jgi:signal transduction histidine kinase
MPNSKFHARLQSLFADIEHLAAQPDADGLDVRRELESLRLRVLELEAEFSEIEKPTSTPESITPVEPKIPASEKLISAPENVAPVEPKTLANADAAERSSRQPILYEKEQVGYAYTGDKLEPLQISTLTGLDIQHAIQIPLTEKGQAVGSMNIQSPSEQEWKSEDADLAEAVAQQVSLQIQNLRLLAAAESARAEAQAATRRFTHESWESYLDAIHQNEHIGFAYDQSAVTPFGEPTPADADFQATVQVMEEQVGELYFKTDPAHPLSEEDKALISAVARQLGQQVESLRLLADASRARADAEEATRRLTRDSWKEYTERKDDSIFGFVYDLNQVTPLTKAPLDINISKPLIVRGETIGEMSVAGMENVSPETADLLAAIAAQTSLHLEALRLTEELQKRAAELQELDRLKSSFLANMSHELRTPLNSILGFSDVMLEGIDGPLTDYMDNDLRLIQKNGQHLLHLINDVLDMAKIESGRMNLHLEKFKVHDVLDEVTNITSTLANEKNVSLFIEPDSDMEIEINADITRLRQVMINLVNNSIKFTEKGKVSIRVDAQGDDRVLITVADTGIGIPDDQLETIFQEFSQVDTSTTRKAGGTGLGLPISRRLVEMHGGRLWAESSGIAGEGSKFYVELPLETELSEVVEKVTK